MKVVKKKSIYNNKYEGEEIVGQILIAEHEYDEKGNVIKSIQYNAEGQSESVVLNEYDGEHLVKAIIEDHQMDSRQVLEHKWDGDLLMETIERYNESQFIKTTFEYNDDKKLLKKLMIDDENVQHGKVLFEYEDNIVHMDEYDENDEVTIERSTTYDEHGNEIQLEVFTEEDEERKVTTYHDEKSIANIKIYRMDKFVLEVTNHFDDKNRIKEIVQQNYRDDTNAKSIYHHDEKDQVIKEENIVNDVLQLLTEHQYDEEGQRINSTSYSRVNDDYYQAEGQKIDIEYW